MLALLDAGADPNAVLPEGETVLMTAARTGASDTVKLLLDHDADLAAREHWFGETALMWAAAEDHPEAPSDDRPDEPRPTNPRTAPSSAVADGASP